jgi:Fe2+ or Zn2+ uptake regulation protein
MAEDLHSLVEHRLRRVDQRYTAGRRAIVDLLACVDRPLTIADIAEARPDLARSSAYRHLVDLQQAGVVRRVAGHDEFGRFELAEELTEHHHHLLCQGCGAVFDVAPSVGLERAVTKALAEVAANEGFEIRGHQVDAVGLCSSCR